MIEAADISQPPGLTGMMGRDESCGGGGKKAAEKVKLEAEAGSGSSTAEPQHPRFNPPHPLLIHRSCV